MNKMKLSVALLILTTGIYSWSSAMAEVIRNQINDINLIVNVTDDVWQPKEFQNGLDVPAVYISRDEIAVDGSGDEPGWLKATEIKIPLTHGNVASASVKALYNDSEVFIRVRWPDDDEDRQHHPWVWNPEQERYVEGPQTEDSLLLSFEAGCDWNSSLQAGYIYDFDGWHWLAAKSDPLGQAVDVIGSVRDHARKGQVFTQLSSRTTADTWNVKFVQNSNADLHADWDQQDRVYMLQPYIPTVYYRAVPDGRESQPFFEKLAAPEATPYPIDEAKIFPQFSPVKLQGGAGEVSAKGRWEEGYWTVEFRRDRFTPARSVNDTIFQRLTQFSVHVFDRTEAIDQASESPRLFLRFLPVDSAVAGS